MAKNFKTSIVITGDSEGGVRAIKATDEQLQKLERDQKRATRSAGELRTAWKHLKSNATLYAGGAAAAAAGVRCNAIQIG